MPGMGLLCQLNPLTAYNLDAAVVAFGVTVENALQETFEIGAGDSKKTIRKYTIGEILAGRLLEREGGSGSMAFLKNSDMNYEEVG